MRRTCAHLLATMLENHAGKQSGYHLWGSPPYFFLKRRCAFFFETMTCNTSVRLDFASCRQYVGNEGYCNGWCVRRYKEPFSIQHVTLSSNFIAPACWRGIQLRGPLNIVGSADAKISKIWDGGGGRPNNLKRRSHVFLFAGISSFAVWGISSGAPSKGARWGDVHVFYFFGLIWIHS